MANGLVDIRPTVSFRIMVANFVDKDVTLAKNEVLALALPGPSKVFTVNVDPREREAVATAKVGLAQALQPDNALAHFAARVPPSPAVGESLTAKDVSLDHSSDEEQAKSLAPCSVNSRTTLLCDRDRTPD